MITCLRHVGLVVHHLGRSLVFYRDILGFRESSRKRESDLFVATLVGINDVDLEWVKLDIPGGGFLELIEYHSHPDLSAGTLPSNRFGCSHVAFTVCDLDGLYKKILESGCVCNSPPLLSPDGKVKVLYCHDYDGIIVELVEELT